MSDKHHWREAIFMKSLRLRLEPHVDLTEQVFWLLYGQPYGQKEKKQLQNMSAKYDNKSSAMVRTKTSTMYLCLCSRV